MTLHQTVNQPMKSPRESSASGHRSLRGLRCWRGGSRRVCLLLVLLTLIGSVLWLYSRGEAGVRPAPSAALQPATVPTVLAAVTQPASMALQPTAAYPPLTLMEDCRSEAARLKTRLNDSFHILVAPPFIVASDLSEDLLRSYVEYSIQKPAEAMWNGYFRHRPDKPITVLLLANGTSYRVWAKKLFNDEDISHFGYYRPSDRALVMNIGTGTGTLVHELTHALIVYDWPDVPVWINEGLASLHEQSQIGDDDIRGLPNWRLPTLQAAIAQGQLHGLANLAENADFYGHHRGLNYAHARYFLLYLQSCGFLKDFYARCRTSAADRISAVAVIESVCGQPVAEVDKQLTEYVKTLHWP